jgi:hypothetical protein
MLGWERSLSLNPGVDPARASIGHSAREAAGVWQPCPPPDIPLRSIRPPDHQDGAAIVPTVSKRKPDAFPGRQPSAKMPKLEPDGSPSFSTPPCNPPGEAFAANFMREYVDRGGLLTRQVTGLASNPARKWGLACELPAGWYVIDDHPGPGQILPHFDSSAAPPCGWKVTGPQMKVFNPDVPVQIRYGNPKDGCTKDYGAMRAAVYTWCRKDAAGAVVEGAVKLIHVYVGRASRNRNAPRRPAGRRAAVRASSPAGPLRSAAPPVAGLATLVGEIGTAVATAGTQTAEDWPSAELMQRLQMEVSLRIVAELRANKMEDAARVAEAVVAKMQTEARSAKGSSKKCCRQQNLSAAAEEERREEEYALQIGAQLRSRQEVIELINKEYVRLYYSRPPHYTEDAIAWLLKHLRSKCKQTARRMARIVIAYEKKHIEDHDITVKSHNMAAKVLHMLGTGVDMDDEDDPMKTSADEGTTAQLPTTVPPRVFSQEEKAVAHDIGSTPHNQGGGKQQLGAKASGTASSATNASIPASKPAAIKGSKASAKAGDGNGDGVAAAPSASDAPSASASASASSGTSPGASAGSSPSPNKASEAEASAGGDDASEESDTSTRSESSDGQVAEAAKKIDVTAAPNPAAESSVSTTEAAGAAEAAAAASAVDAENPPEAAASAPPGISALEVGGLDDMRGSSDDTNLSMIDIEDLASEPGPTCLAPLSTIQSERDQLCKLSDCYEAWDRSGVVCPTKRLPERSEQLSRYEAERRECPTQVETENHIYSQTLQCPAPLADSEEEEIKARYQALNRYDLTFPGSEQRQSQLSTSMQTQPGSSAAASNPTETI